MPEQLPKPTDGELEILRVLWDRGPSTVREVHSALNAERTIGYTTILKLMQIMVEKGLVTRDESQRSHIYRARERREVTQRKLVRDLLARAFGGSTDQLVLQVLSAKKATPVEIASLRRLLDELERKEKRQ